MFDIFECLLLKLLLLLLLQEAFFLEVVCACDAIYKLMVLNRLILDILIASCGQHELFRLIGISRSVLQLDFVPGASSGSVRLRCLVATKLLDVELVLFMTIINFILVTKITFQR